MSDETSHIMDEYLAHDIARIRDMAASVRQMNSMLIRWHADRVRIQLGQVEVVDPDTPGAREVHCLHACAPYGHFHFVKDRV